MNNRDVYVVAAVRTAIGGFGGSLKDHPLLIWQAKLLQKP